MIVHLHAWTAVNSHECATVCGLACGSRETTAYRGLDPERVTCTVCLGAVS